MVTQLVLVTQGLRTKTSNGHILPGVWLARHSQSRWDSEAEAIRGVPNTQEDVPAGPKHRLAAPAGLDVCSPLDLA